MAICVPRKVATVALLGGGRWARVHATVLTSSWPGLCKLLLVSRHNKISMEAWARNHPGTDSLLLDAREQLASHRPDAAIVCTASAAHVQDAGWLLAHDIAVLVEKPLALDVAAAQSLTREAERRGQVLCVSLPFAMAGYLREFKAECGTRRIARARMEWLDCASEVRYGEAKVTDFSTHRVDDAVPHIWSIFALLLGDRAPTVNAVFDDAPDTVGVRAAWGGAEVEISFGRHSGARRRRLDVWFDGGAHLGLDFTEESRLTILDGDSRRPVSWDRHPGPLEAVQKAFLTAVEQGDPAAADPLLVARCLESVRLAACLRSAAVSRDALRLGELIDNPSESARARILLLENVGPEAVDLGRRLSHAGEDEKRNFADAGLAALRRAGAPDAAWEELFEGSAFLRQVLAHRAGKP